MIDKKIYDERLERAKEIALGYGLEDLCKDFDVVSKFNKNYNTKVLFIGNFSSGKSALLNCVLGSQLLKENQLAETAIATELYFSETPQILSTTNDGSKNEITDLEAFDPDSSKNLEYYVNCENLKLLSDYILVDTPGFDSGIERHNKALMQYVREGTVYILVIDCEKGTVPESALKFIDEVTGYKGDVGVVISKCDKILPSDLECVKNNIMNILENRFNRTFPVACVSKWDDDAGQKVVDLITSFDPHNIYEYNIGSLVRNREANIINALELIKKSQTLDIGEIDAQIKMRQVAVEELEKQLASEQQRAAEVMKENTKEEIKNAVRNGLNAHISDLVYAYQGGADVLKAKIVEIIRPILVSNLENYSSEKYENLVSQINITIEKKSSCVDELSDIFYSVNEKLKKMNEDMQIEIIEYDEPNDIDMGDVVDGTTLLTSILAVVTDVIAPWLEVIIILLPSAIKLINILLGKKPEDQIEQQIKVKVIPNIVLKIGEQIDKPINTVDDRIFNSFNSSIRRLIEVENEALESLKNSKTEKTEIFEQKIAQIDSDIKKLTY